jgi:hypothetical protein
MAIAVIINARMPAPQTGARQRLTRLGWSFIIEREFPAFAKTPWRCLDNKKSANNLREIRAYLQRSIFFDYKRMNFSKIVNKQKINNFNEKSNKL